MAWHKPAIVVVVVNILRKFLTKQLFHSRSLDIRLLSTRRALSTISYLTRARWIIIKRWTSSVLLSLCVCFRLCCIENQAPFTRIRIFLIHNVFLPDFSVYTEIIKIEFAIPVYCSVKDWIRFYNVIGFEYIRIHPSTHYRVPCNFFSTLESGLKNIGIRCHCHVNGSRFRRKELKNIRIRLHRP